MRGLRVRASGYGRADVIHGATSLLMNEFDLDAGASRCAAGEACPNDVVTASRSRAAARMCVAAGLRGDRYSGRAGTGWRSAAPWPDGCRAVRRPGRPRCPATDLETVRRPTGMTPPRCVARPVCVTRTPRRPRLVCRSPHTPTPPLRRWSRTAAPQRAQVRQGVRVRRARRRQDHRIALAPTAFDESLRHHLHGVRARSQREKSPSPPG